MKKIIFSIFALTLAMLVGCQGNFTEDNGNNNETQLITITATIEGSEQSRVALTPSTDSEGSPIVKVAWNAGDETFRLFGIEEDPIKIWGPSTFTQIDDSNQFSGNNPCSYGAWWYIATYPASDLITVTGSDGNYYATYDKSIYTSQNGKLSEDKTMMATSMTSFNANGQFEFEHKTTLLMPKFRIVGQSVNLTPDKIATITFKDMLVLDGTADFTIDCSSHSAEDDIYVYLPYTLSGGYGDGAKSEIEIVVNTTDGKTCEGAINIPAGTTLALGKLYTASVWLTLEEHSNVITYTTSNGEQLKLSDHDWENIYTSHTFEHGMGKITLRDDVTSIPQYGFYCQYDLASIELPSAITTIDSFAFSGATSLLSINLQHITAIKNSAFQNCRNISQITMPQNSYTIDVTAFTACESITEIDLSNATSIDSYAFLSCANLKTVVVNNETPPTLGEFDIFLMCDSLESIYVPDAAVSSYQSAWSAYSDKIKPISEM